MQFHPSRTLAVIVILSVVLSPTPLFAVGSSGFENASYSARSLGQGNAVVARPEDPDTVVFNPAGLPELKNVQVSGNLEGILVRTYFHSARDGARGASTPQVTLIPTGFITANLGERLDNRVGVGVGWTYPFGVSNKYPSTSQMGGYAGYKNSIQLAALTLAAGVKLHEKFNIGGGAINYNIMQYDRSFNYPNSYVLKALGINSPDGLVNTYQHGNAWGWMLGALAKPIDHHQIGFFYRSKANVKTHGRAKATGLVLGALQGYDTEPYFETGIKSDVQLPSNITLGYAYKPSKKWAAEVDVAWTGWSVFADQNITFDRNNATTQALGQIPRNYHNSLSLNMGGHYLLSKKWDLLGGIFIYSAASPEDHFDVVIPDSDRYAANLGVSYKITPKLDFTTSGMFILFGENSISNPELTHKLGHSVDGEYNTLVYGLMSGFTYRFGKVEEEPEAASIQKGPSPIIKEFPKTG